MSSEDGHVIYKYDDGDLKDPMGLYCDSEDNVLVCASNNVQVITADGKKKCTLLRNQDGLDGPRCIVYKQSNDTLIVSCYWSDNLRLFKLTKYTWGSY